MNWGRFLAITAMCASIAVGCASPSAPASAGPTLTPIPATATPQATSIATPGPTASPVARIEGRFDVGGGRELYVRCIGSGSPTILLEAGDGDPGPDHWRFVSGKLDDSTRTCLYDRAGLGRSDAATGCRQMDDLLDDLDGLLAAAKISGPYVLVGASGGGFIMAGFAARHPEQVAGMVFVETPKALTVELAPAALLADIKCDAPGNTERRDFVAVEHAAWDNRAELADFPVTVLSNDYGALVNPGTDEATNVADQRGWFDLTSGTTLQVVVTSGHNIAGDDPDLVVKEVLAVLKAAQAT